jgi:RNA polymerase sigma-70 factor (ECF subfamily)
MTKNISVIETNNKHDCDENFIKKCQNGDREAFNKLVKKYQNDVFNICFRFLGNKDDAYDTAQDIFIKVYESIHEFKFKASFMTWLYRITLNTCKNKSTSNFKRNSLIKNIETLNNDDERVNIVEMIGDKSPAILDEILAKQRDEIVQKIINSLPFLYKNIIILSDIHGCSHKEIAQLCDLNISTVKTRLIRGRNLIRMKLEGLL